MQNNLHNWLCIFILCTMFFSCRSFEDKDQTNNLEIPGSGSVITIKDSINILWVNLTIPETEYGLEVREDLIRKLVIIKLDSLFNVLGKDLVVFNQDCAGGGCKHTYLYDKSKLYAELQFRELDSTIIKLLKIRLHDVPILDVLIKNHNEVKKIDAEHNFFYLMLEARYKCVDNTFSKEFKDYIESLVRYTDWFIGLPDSNLNDNHFRKIYLIVCPSEASEVGLI